MRYYESTFKVQASIVRPFNLYGPGQAPEFLIPMLLRQAVDQNLPEITVADDRPRRDYLYVGDFVDLLLRLARGPKRGIFNAGSGHSTGIPELVGVINGILGTAKPLVSRGESRPNEVFDLFAGIDKAQSELGWTPRTSLEIGLRKTLESMNETSGVTGDSYG